MEKGVNTHRLNVAGFGEIIALLKYVGKGYFRLVLCLQLGSLGVS